MGLQHDIYFTCNRGGLTLQQAVKILYAQKKYTDDIGILALGLCEEVGEVAAAVLDLDTGFKIESDRPKSDLKHELKDCLIYLCAIANSVGIDLEI